MTYIVILAVILAVIFYVIYLLKNSTSDFFNQKKYNLNLIWLSLIDNLLINYNFNKLDKIRFREAYNYFIDNPSHFDGATIVKDITQIKGLDIPAMAYDHAYIMAKNIKDRLKADWQYSQDYRKFEVPWTIAYSRMVLLIFINITGIYYLGKFLKK